jgi:hypothetical protein
VLLDGLEAAGTVASANAIQELVAQVRGHLLAVIQEWTKFGTNVKYCNSRVLGTVCGFGLVSVLASRSFGL